MANLINDFLSMPLWLSIPLCVVYLALLAYFVYILWRYRGKSNLVMNRRDRSLSHRETLHGGLRKESPSATAASFGYGTARR